MIRFALPLIALPMIGCTPGQHVPVALMPPPQIQPTPCGSHHVAHLVGKTRSAALEADVRRLTGAERIRWIAPGMAVTMDYSETRLNVRVDDKGVIKSFTCG